MTGNCNHRISRRKTDFSRVFNDSVKRVDSLIYSLVKKKSNILQEWRLI